MRATATWRRAALGLGAAAAVAVTPSIARTLAETPGVVVLAAAAPAACWAAVVATRARRSGAALPTLVAALLGGATVAAVVSSFLIAALALRPTLGAPLGEELAKGATLALVLALGPGHAAVHGVLVGVGFAMTENLGYLTLAAVQGGPAGLARGVWVRGVLEGLNHGIFTGATGAGLGWGGRSTGARLLAAALGLGAAIGQHLVWNRLGAGAVTDVLCNAASPGGACRGAPDAVDLLLGVPLAVAATLAPGAVGLVLASAARRGG